MSDPTYDSFRSWRAALTDTELAQMRPGYLRALSAELKATADTIDAELARRERATDRQDARLYKPRGRP